MSEHDELVPAHIYFVAVNIDVMTPPENKPTYYKIGERKAELTSQRYSDKRYNTILFVKRLIEFPCRVENRKKIEDIIKKLLGKYNIRLMYGISDPKKSCEGFYCTYRQVFQAIIHAFWVVEHRMIEYFPPYKNMFLRRDLNTGIIDEHQQATYDDLPDYDYLCMIEEDPVMQNIKQKAIRREKFIEERRKRGNNKHRLKKAYLHPSLRPLTIVVNYYPTGKPCKPQRKQRNALYHRN